MVNLMVWGKGSPAGFTLSLSEPSSRPIQVGSRGQETNQVDSGADRTLRPSLGIKTIISFSSLLEGFYESRFWQRQLKVCPTAQCTCNSLLSGSFCAMVRSHPEEGGALSLFTRSFAKIRGRNRKSLPCSSKRHFFVSLYTMTPAFVA